MGAAKKIFFSYSNHNEDLELYNKIYKHFAAYSKIGLLGIIDKKEIFRINNDKTRINEILKESDITIPLLSIDYVTDDECLEQFQHACSQQRKIVPVLLRDFDWESFQDITQHKKNILPLDKTSVQTHLGEDSNKEEVFKEIALRIKGMAIPEIGALSIQQSPKMFYYIIAALVLAIGAIAAWLLYDHTRQILFSLMAFLMFVCIALLSLKNVLFPGKIKITR